MYNIQANFVDVSAPAHEITEGWGWTHGASLTNDIIIDFVLDDSVPVLQLGFGDLNKRTDGKFPSEDGCQPMKHYVGHMPDSWSSEPNLMKCRKRCEENTDGCTKFHFWYNGDCFLNYEDHYITDTPALWGRSLAGSLSSNCGLPPPEMEIKEIEQRMKHGMIGQHCPLLFFVDGQMVDISYRIREDINGYIYGDESSDVSVVIKDLNIVEIAYKLDNDETATVRLIAKGDGPGEIWSCHWDFFVCLPVSQQNQFEDYSIGLLGTPDGIMGNDFMDADGNQLLLTAPVSWHETMIDYCYHNWCVSQEDSIMTYPADMAYEDVKCAQEPHTDVENNCVVSADYIHAQCDDQVPLIRYACELDCCVGGCNQVPDTVDEITDIITLNIDDDCVNHDDFVFVDPICDENGFQKTSDDVCPFSETPIVSLVNSAGGVDIPEGAPVFYDIQIDSGSDIMDRTVKFRVTNPFDSSADVFVKYDKRTPDSTFKVPHCDEMSDTVAGCDPSAPEIEVSCHEYQGINPFAIVKVYFASAGLTIDGDSSVDKCCHPPTYDSSTGVVGYTFEIQCHCPDGTTEEL